MQLPQLVQMALDKARSITLTASGPGPRHAERSKNWVESLADVFRLRFCEDPSVRVLSKYCPGHRADFGLNELLFDVSVVRTDTVPSAGGTQPLRYVTEALWQVESEFARDSRQAVFDFNKLVLGSGANKLFAGPLVRDRDAFLRVLAAPAARCTGTVYLVLLPHPDEWDDGPRDPACYQFSENTWRPL